MIKLALLGFGTVGQGVYRILDENPALQERFAITTILVRDKQKKRETEVENARLTEDADAVFSDPSIDCFVELTGEVEGMQAQLTKVLQSGKHMVTANKALVSRAMEELETAAARGGAAFLYEAAVAGAVPVVKAMKDLARISPADEIEGILNGTCNFILSRMEQGESYESALQEAQDAGFAEADPSADVEGYDTQRKLRILATLGFNAQITEADVPCRGIAQLEARDLAILKAHGRKVKLLGIAQRKDRRISARVLPVCIPAEDAFANVDGSMNSVRVRAQYPLELTWTGPGAGMYPTAHAVWNDILDAFENTAIAPSAREALVNANTTSEDVYYLRTAKPVEQSFPGLPWRPLDEARIVGPVHADLWKDITNTVQDAHWALWIDE